MKIEIVYQAPDFFGNSTQMRATDYFATHETAKKVFSYLKKNYECGVHTDSDSFYFDTYSDFNNGIITIVHYNSENDRDIEKMSTERAKKIFYALFPVSF